MPNPKYSSLHLPKEICAEIDRLSQVEDRTKAAVVKRMLAAYHRQQAELVDGLK